MGVVVIATLLALSFWFSVAFGVSLATNPPEPEVIGIVVEVDYFTQGRIWFSLIASVMLTGITWAVAASFTPE